MRKYASGNKLNLNILSFFQLCIWDPLYIFEDFEGVWDFEYAHSDTSGIIH